MIVAVSICFAILGAGIPLAVSLAGAESIAEKLAPKLNVDANELREKLQPILAEGSMRRGVMCAAPFLILAGMAEMILRSASDM